MNQLDNSKIREASPSIFDAEKEKKENAKIVLKKHIKMADCKWEKETLEAALMLVENEGAQ